MNDLNDDFVRHISSEFNEELEALRRSTLEMGGARRGATAICFAILFDSGFVSIESNR